MVPRDTSGVDRRTFLKLTGGNVGTPDDAADDEWVWRTVIGDTAGAAFRALEQGHNTLGVINATAEGARSWVEGFRGAYEATPEAVQQNLGPVSRDGGTEVTTFEEGKTALDDGDEITYQGAATPTTFTDFGNVVGPVVVSEAQDGEFEELEVIPEADLRDFVPEDEY
jgi:branched-chain amino acid transport system substrate-binding protein